MRVCIIYDGDYPWDVRIEKMTVTLVEHGYQVHLICRNLGRRPVYEFINGLHIHRLTLFANDAINNLSSFPAFLNPVWISKIRNVIKKFSVDLIIVRDLPLALAAVLIGKMSRLPVIFDMAENYPAMLGDIWKYDEFKLMNLFVRNPAVARTIESLVLKTVAHVIAVIEESKERLISLGLSASTISIVRNTPVLSSQNYKKVWSTSSEDESSHSHDLKLIYVGGLEPMRGLEALIRSVPQLVEQIKHLRLTIVGGGKWQPQLQSEVSRLGLGQYVTLTGRLPYPKALKQVEQSDAGLIPHRVTPHTDSTIPNKLFEYMMNGIPVIATDMAPVRRIIKTVRCGYVYSNIAELTTALRSIADDATRKELGANAQEAIYKQYNWNVDAKAFLQGVQTALQKLPSPRLSTDTIDR